LTVQQEEKLARGKVKTGTLSTICEPRPPRVKSHPPTPKTKELSFIWLDEFFHYSNDYLNQIITPSKWYVFTDISTCILHIENQLREENKIFLVVSSSFGHQLFLSSSHLISLISFVYIYHSQIDFHINWIENHPQVRGMYNDFIQLGEKIKQDLRRYIDNTPQYSFSTDTIDESPTTSLSLIVYNEEHARLFFAVQRTIDTLLSMPHTAESRNEMLDECRRICENNDRVLAEINTFDQMYQSNAALQWYSRDTFLFRIINKVLRSNNVNTMFNLRYFLADLYEQLNELHIKESIFDPYQKQQIEKVYRGQQISKNEFEYFQQIQGNIISINTFLSTTKSLQIALCFANSMIKSNNLIPVLFCIDVNRSSAPVRPYANISKLSMFEDEEEVLFSMGSIFRVEHIETLDKKDNIPVIYLSLVDLKELEKSNFFKDI
jgi:hypothetical protein